MSSNPTAPPITPAASAANEALKVIADVAQSATTPAIRSKRFSFKGYSFLAWVQKNAEWIKGFLAAETAALGAQQWKLAAALALGALAKWTYDAVDYFVSVN